MTAENTNKTLACTTLILRISIFLFLLPWGIEKFTKPEQTAKIFAHFYKIGDLPVPGSYAVGVLWVLLLIAFAIGFKKRLSYGLVVLFHGVGTLMTMPQLLPFLPTHNHLFLAAIPTLGAMIALYLLREHDTIWTVKG